MQLLILNKFTKAKYMLNLSVLALFSQLIGSVNLGTGEFRI